MEKQKIMRKIVKATLFFVFFMWLGYFSFVLFFKIDSKQEKYLASQEKQIARLSKQQIQLLREGDIILRRGYGFFSDAIAKRLNDSLFEVTHAGILCKKNGRWTVIHILSSQASQTDGIQEQRLADFLKYSMPKKTLVVRPKNITPQQGKSIANRAKFYLSKHIPFDHLGTIDDTTKMYCTELIWQILGTDLQILNLPQGYQQRKRLFYSMRGLYSPEYFEIIVDTR